MNYIKLIPVLAMLLPFGLSAQVASPEKTITDNWKLSYVSANFGPQGDHYFNMDMDFMESRISDANYQRLDLSGLDLEKYTYSDIGMNFNVQLNFSQGAKPTGTSSYTELQVGLGAVLGREVMIDYTDRELGVMPIDDINGMDDFTSLTFCDLQNEISISGAYKKGISFNNVLKIYTGIGAQMGTTVGSQFWIFGERYYDNDQEQIESTQDVYDVKESMMGRIYVPLGGEIVLMDKLHLTGEVRLGYGRHQTFRGTGYSNMNYAVLAGIGWSL